MKAPVLLLSLSVLASFQIQPLIACGIHDLVKPNLNNLREAAEEERQKEEARQQKLREEEEAKRLEEEARQAVLDAIKNDPLVDPESVKLAAGLAGKESYKIESGGTLGAIAADRYGSSQYFPIVEHWNGVKATKIFVGQVIKTPSIATIVKVKGSKVLARYPEEVAGMLQLHKDFLALEPKLRANEGELSDETKEALKEMYASSKKVHAGFLVKRPGVESYANGLLAQCKNVVDQFAAFQKGDFGRGKSRITRVHTSLAYALRNAMIWGEEDFK